MAKKQTANHNSQADTFRILMAQDVETEKLGGQLEAMGLPPTYENAVCLAALRKAAEGDLSAYKLIRDVLEEHPRQSVAKPLLSRELGRLTDEELERLADSL